MGSLGRRTVSGASRARPRGVPRPPGPRLRSLLLLALAPTLFAEPGELAAQQVRFTPRADRPVERRLDDFLKSADYRVLSADTVLREAAQLDRSLLVLDAAVRVATTIPGSVFVVDGDLFLRPGARIEGDVVVLGGGIGEKIHAQLSHRRDPLP